MSWTGSLNYSGWGAGSCSVHSHRAVQLLSTAQRGKKQERKSYSCGYSRAGTHIIPFLLVWDSASILWYPPDCHQQHIHPWIRHLFFFWIISLTNISQGHYQPESVITPVVRSLFAYTQKQVSSYKDRPDLSSRLIAKTNICWTKFHCSVFSAKITPAPSGLNPNTVSSHTSHNLYTDLPTQQ